MLWKYYSKDAYTIRARPPLKNSDHNVIQLLPMYRSVFKSNKLETQIVKVWTDGKVKALKGCFLCTVWDIPLKDADINNATESITAYITFCINSFIPQKTVKWYPNNKLYFTTDIKECFKKKRQLLSWGTKQAEQDLVECKSKKLWDLIRQIPSDWAKVAYIISHLTGRAEAWAKAQWSCKSLVCSPLILFTMTISKIFHRKFPGLEAARAFMGLSTLFALTVRLDDWVRERNQICLTPTPRSPGSNISLQLHQSLQAPYQLLLRGTEENTGEPNQSIYIFPLSLALNGCNQDGPQPQ